MYNKNNFKNNDRSDTTAQHKNNNLDYMINPTFRNISKLFFQSFKISENVSTRHSLLSIPCH